MRSSKRIAAVAALAAALLTVGCGDDSDSSNSSSGSAGSGAVSSLSPIAGNNVMPLTVNGSLCSAGSYANKPCVSVTICTPGTSNCQTINDILLDTGSYGLRVFSQALNVSLTQVMSGENALAECVQFGDGSADWGSVKTASVILGNEAAVTVPIQVIDSTFGDASKVCAGADTSPSEAGFNGILGVGIFAQDCGDYCSSETGNGMYYSCSGSTCLSVATSNQVQNPVSALTQDNNGVVVELPNVALGGIDAADGYVLLGIGTQTNNTASSATKYNADPSSGEMTTRFNGSNLPSFLDTGSNGLFFAAPSANVLPNCGSDGGNWFCPTNTQSLNATNTGSNGSPTSSVTFQIGNASNLMNSGNNVFIELGGATPGEFDWGLPFYYGRNVYVGIEGTSSSLGTGPYWAF